MHFGPIRKKVALAGLDPGAKCGPGAFRGPVLAHFGPFFGVPRGPKSEKNFLKTISASVTPVLKSQPVGPSLTSNNFSHRSWGVYTEILPPGAILRFCAFFFAKNRKKLGGPHSASTFCRPSRYLSSLKPRPIHLGPIFLELALAGRAFGPKWAKSRVGARAAAVCARVAPACEKSTPPKKIRKKNQR